MCQLTAATLTETFHFSNTVRTQSLGYLVHIEPKSGSLAHSWLCVEVLWCHQAESRQRASCLPHPGRAEISGNSSTSVLRHVLTSHSMATPVIFLFPSVGLWPGPDTEPAETLHEFYHRVYCKEMLICPICIVFDYQRMLVCLKCWNNSINPYELWSDNERY